VAVRRTDDAPLAQSGPHDDLHDHLHDDPDDDLDDGAARRGSAADDHSGDDDGDVVVLAWWRNPWTIAAIALAIAALAGTIGYVAGHNGALDDPGETDVGFLQDMRVHHEQAVALSFTYLNNDRVDRDLRTVAATILLEQQLEIGRMIQMLHGFGEPEINETDTAMEWMGHAVPVEQMHGLVSDADLQRLRDSSGAEADAIFVELMTEHHLGGIEMAGHALDHARVDEVQTMAAQIVKGQREEVDELARLLARSR
jgi:uncharacterized protein (DUF305 family)